MWKIASRRSSSLSPPASITILSCRCQSPLIKSTFNEILRGALTMTFTLLCSKIGRHWGRGGAVSVISTFLLVISLPVPDRQHFSAPTMLRGGGGVSHFEGDGKRGICRQCLSLFLYLFIHRKKKCCGGEGTMPYSQRQEGSTVFVCRRRRDKARVHLHSIDDVDCMSGVPEINRPILLP